MPTLLETIGNRTVLIDSNLPIQLADSLRRARLSVRHVNEINPRMSDIHVQNIMLPTDVLLTRDANLYWKVKGKAIFLGLGTSTRRNVAFTSKLKATLDDEKKRGITEFRIKRGMRMLFA